MLVEEADKPALKDWLIPKVESISDADAGVLADYVIALIGADESESNVRRNCLESLSDFLADDTANFIDEVIAAVKAKAFLPTPKPSAPAPVSKLLPSPALSAEAPPFNPPTGPSASLLQQPRPAGLPNTPPSRPAEQSRKRRYNERATSQPRDAQDLHYQRGPGADRPVKQVRGHRNSRGGPGAMNAHAGVFGLGAASVPVPSMPNYPGLPTPPPGMPPFDPSNPMALLEMMSGLFPGMLPMPFAGLNQQQSGGRKGRCRDYDTKGYCALGSACPYEHGEYDPSLAMISSSEKGSRAKGHRSNHRSKRAAFSLPGPNFDRFNTSIVVEQIPEENFSEDDVRDFFSKFGDIVDVNMQAYKRLAVVKFDDYFAAKAAYDSPKVIFDNRFVKVYWFKPDSLPKPPANGTNDANDGDDSELAKQEDKEMIDPEEVEKRQAEAQKAFEERRKKIQDADARAEEIEKQLGEKAEQMRILKEQLAKKGGQDNGASLIDQLSSLQAEAQDLNAEQHELSSFSTRGRGAYRGRGSYFSRGHGYAPSRGMYRGRGSFPGARSGVKRLDNRPKTVAVTGLKVGSKEDEALRQYLLSAHEHDSVEPHPDKPDTQVITFKERYVAEMFLEHASTGGIPDVGKLELAWVPNAATTGKTDTPPSSEVDSKMEDTNATMAAQTNGGEDTNNHGNSNGGDADYDVADDEDRWMAT